MQSSSQSRFFTFAASGSIFLFILAVFVFFLALLAGCSKQASGAPSPVSVEVARLETALAEKGFPSGYTSSFVDAPGKARLSRAVRVPREKIGCRTDCARC